MIIGIDGNEANIEKRVGVNVYAFELLCSIYQLQNEWKDKHRVIVYLKSHPREDMPKENTYWHYKVLPGSALWIITKLTPNLFWDAPKPDIFLTPSHYVPLLSPVPTVCSIMDVGYLKFSAQFKKSDFWQLSLWSAWSIFVSKTIIAISNSTKKDIVRHYPFASGKVEVTHLAYDSKLFNIRVSKEDVRRVASKYSIVNEYFLYLGTLKPSKNVEGLIEAYAKVAGRYPNFGLVIGGKKGWLYETIFEKAKNLGLENKVIFTDFIDEKDKPALIAGAKAFVLPSFWEGFGLDVLNAMACGIPVIVSNVGSLPEVAGDAGIYVDPYNINSIADALVKVLSMNQVDYNKVVKAGLEQAGKFSWEKTARETLKILESSNV
ncbi:hypothetical protein A2210_02235 [Candidatus Woesebacteria bacterium RIFOXYA1_FULL_40_18]|uniref:Glycosyl transferase family 1 domain-containing protein n=4 Tax=Candidatus Woeseibacteriota TaxID=1752722 RepID=A0A1F8CIP7_9BACT|nr:MAG: Glycosyl transferase group 1 [Candidatus Woesebacteria bacterium GW2011_GWB1_40_101]OGM76243.1 MAG: hypothetical protein A2210_02235 [Candidatus Woesebacteria bacterium RIFOXYA1_FULL_40_18]OGM80553.1 MAG: hypothetical protein A2361_00450 [Candidatus Woesebacteria bacterium RIFOXYB1_FULL_40_26]OGM87590.1 MAG: hypothetical protein A2614_02345 [Candidatus Woesebacteria bacterium RIFOXYD1_FULL_40_21]